MKTTSNMQVETLGPHDLAAMIAAVDPAARMSFERVLRLVARVLGMPMAAITVVKNGQHTAPYAVGMENPEHKVYICSYAIRSDDLEIIPDTYADPRVAQMDVVTGYPHVRFYAGMPLITLRGERLGTLAVMDTVPRILSQQQKEDIKIFADQVMFQLEVRNQSEELHVLAGKLQDAYRLARIGSWEWERSTNRLTWSYEVYRMLGRDPADPIDNPANFLQKVHAEDRQSVSAAHDMAIDSQFPYELDYRVLNADGQVTFLHERGEAVRDRDGKVLGLFGYVQDITTTRLAEEARRESDELFRSVFDQAAVGITLTRLDGRFVQVNRKFASLLGYTPSELSQVSFQSLTHPDDLAQDLRLLKEVVENRRETYTMEKRYLHKNGSAVWSRLTVSVRRNAKGAPLHYIAIVEDISMTKRAEADLHAQQQLTSEIINALPVNIYVKDAEGRYLMFNEESAKTISLSKDEAVGKTDFDLFPQHIAAAIREKDRQVLADRDFTLEEATIISHGQKRVMLAGRKAIHTGDGSPKLLGFAIDIHDRKESELRAQYLASHDPLTGLPNRSLLNDRLDHAIARAHRSKSLIAVMFLDLDRFKMVNDSFGHASGDRLLRTMAARLQRAVRTGDTVARLGGDEFVILLEDLAREDDATHIAEQVLRQLSQPVTLDSHELVVSTSIGISVYPKANAQDIPQDARSASALLREADIAMYQAKEKDGNCLRYFDPAMNQRVVESLLMENALRKSLSRDELTLHYQPIVDLKTGGLAGMEALVRWAHPEKGFLGPNQFMWIAEETGLIIDLGEWVLRAACRQLQAWRRMGLSVPRVAVNLSSKQFAPRNLVALVRSALEESEIDAHLLKLEITETGLMEDMARANDALLELAAMGIEVAIDDFGTGYSSLSYLKSLPIDTLKVDRSFVYGVATDANDAAIVAATVGLAHHLGLRVIAEGIETPQQLACLVRQQCDEGQGYYFSPPVPPSDMEALLRTDRPYAAAVARSG